MDKRYVPSSLSDADARKQTKALESARKGYKKKRYISRPHLTSFKSHTSPHITKAKRMYSVERVAPSKELARASGCSVNAMREIVRKGEGAYYSSGSRPNQSAQSWAYARLGSALTGGAASRVDYKILERGCSKTSRALRLATNSSKSRKPRSKSRR